MRRNLTDDVNAAKSGLPAGDATEIVVDDGHGSGSYSGPAILEDDLGGRGRADIAGTETVLR
jgi:hypothetical protein